MDREEKVKENMNKIRGIVFGQCNRIFQSVMKGGSDYVKKSKYCYCLWLVKELKKITLGVYIKSNPRLYIIEQFISFFTMHEVPAETNDEYFYRFNSRIQNLVLSGVKTFCAV